MKSTGLLTFGLCLCFLFPTYAGAQNPGFPQPTEEHKVVMQDVGEWKIKGKMMVAPGQFQEFEGEEKCVAVGGFWAVTHYSSNIFGQKMHGSATTGYDPAAKKYVGTWVDSLMPHPTRMVGTYDADKKTLTYNTTGMGMDGKPMPGKIVILYKDKDSRHFTMMHQDPTGQSTDMVKTMEMSYTRVK